MNSGVSNARNLGIDLAKRQYLSFVDSDDFLEANHLKSLITIANNTEKDTLSIVSSTRYYVKNGKRIKKISISGDFKAPDIIENIIDKKQLIYIIYHRYGINYFPLQL